MAAARAWSRAAAAGKILKRGQKPDDLKSRKVRDLIRDPRTYFAKLYGVGEKFVEMARDLYLDDPLSAGL